MKTRLVSFNIYLCLALLAGFSGCKTTEEKTRNKEASTIRLHLEAYPDGTKHNSEVPVYRESPVLVNANREPFLTEGDVQEAAVVDTIGGFVIRIQFNRHGALVMEGITASNKGKRIAIQSHFGELRWLAAPLITRRIGDGILLFTPDASREESERVVRGLNNLVATLKKRDLFKISNP
jgi:hypothetical protein